MKKCPYCAEEIQEEAVVCRYCGRDLVQIPIEPKPVTPQNPDAIPLDRVIANYVSDGYRVTMQNQDGAQLAKSKRFPGLLLVIAFIAIFFNFFAGIGVLALALIIYLLSKDRTAYLAKRADGLIVSTDQDGYKITHKVTHKVTRVETRKLTPEQRQAQNKEIYQLILIFVGLLAVIVVAVWVLATIY